MITPGSEVAAIDLFCGAGGLSLGLQRVGITILGGIDDAEYCRDVYQTGTGAPYLRCDVRDLDGVSVRRYFDDAGARVRIVAGCAPCQTFSSAGANATVPVSDHRWQLLLEISRIAIESGAHVVLMENVPGMRAHAVFGDFLDRLQRAQYHISYGIVGAADYGVPQRRRRLLLLASRIGPIEMIGPTVSVHRTVRDAIAHLPPLDAGCTDARDSMHRCNWMGSISLARMRASYPGGTRCDWPEELWMPCFRRLIEACPVNPPFPDAYGRMSWDLVAPTITTRFQNYGSGRFGHPDQDRTLSLREGALLQSFPPTLDFGNAGLTRISRMIGNAVPPLLGEALGISVERHLR